MRVYICSQQCAFYWTTIKCQDKCHKVITKFQSLSHTHIYIHKYTYITYIEIGTWSVSESALVDQVISYKIGVECLGASIASLKTTHGSTIINHIQYTLNSHLCPAVLKECCPEFQFPVDRLHYSLLHIAVCGLVNAPAAPCGISKCQHATIWNKNVVIPHQTTWTTCVTRSVIPRNVHLNWGL